MTTTDVPAAAGRPSVAELEAALRAAFDATSLAVTDDSHLHAGHAGARSGGGHFSVRLVTSAFEGLPRIARHRLVYDALATWWPAGIHALALQTLTPTEASRS